MSELNDKPAKRSFRSIISVPIKVEMAPVEHVSNRVLTTEELQEQIDEARKGKAKVDNQYVNYDEAGHLFDYKYNYVRYLDNVAYVLAQAKERKANRKPDVYQNPHRMIIQ
jgi:hypothetical protein